MGTCVHVHLCVGVCGDLMLFWGILGAAALVVTWSPHSRLALASARQPPLNETPVALAKSGTGECLAGLLGTETSPRWRVG